MPERSSGEQRRGPHPPRRLGGPDVCVAGLVQQSGALAGRREQEQQPCEVEVVDRLVALARRHGAAEQIRGVLIREPRIGPLRRPHRERHGPVDLLGPRGREVAREVVEMGVEALTVTALDRLADPAVQARPACGR